MSLVVPGLTDQLDELLGVAIAEFDIPDELYERAVQRYMELGAWFDEYWSQSPDDGLIYPQGSFRLGTVVQPIHPDDEYDIDLVCRRDLDKSATTQAELKRDVGVGLRSYVAASPEGSPTCDEGKRCWTLSYPHEPFHMDVLPALPRSEGSAHAIWLTDKQLNHWQPSNPAGYSEWFREQMREAAVRLLETLAKRMEVQDVPDWRIKTPLQRTVQALKRHRDIHFADRPEERPASIIISTLAARAFTGQAPLYETLVDITERMPGLVENHSGVYWVANPVQPDENFADRWRSDPLRAQTFFDWVTQAHEDFQSYGVDAGIDRVVVKLSESFGERPASRAGEVIGKRLRNARNAGALAMTGTGVLTRGPGRPIPRHTFHGDSPAGR